MRKRVLHVIGNLGLGGAQAVLYHLWPSLHASRRYKIELCTLNGLGHFGEQLLAEGATVHALNSRGKYDPTVILKLRALIKSGGYRLVHAHLFPELHTVALAASGLRDVRLVYTEHLATNRRRRFGVAGRLFDRIAYQAYREIIAVNASTSVNLRTWQPQLSERLHIIRNGVRANPFSANKAELLAELGLPSNCSKTLILFAGRLSYQKGLDILLSALAQLTRDDYLCVIAGEGEERAGLEAMTERLALGGRVRFIGSRSDVQRLLRQADLLVLPSRFEGLPIIILEAMAAGCPILATAVDGNAEILRDQETALLVPPEDVRALAEALGRLLDQPTLRANLAAQASQSAEVFSATENARRLMAVYDQALAKPSVLSVEKS